MKKTFVILTIVLAILAAPVFAEVTASGEVDFEWAFNADDYAEQVDSNDMIINLGGTVGDYTSISAEFEGEYADDNGDISDGKDADGEDNDDAVYLNQATLTQDITGALGIESPVSVALTFGIDSLGDDPVQYNELAGYGYSSDGQLDPGTIMTKLSLGIDTFTLDFSVYEDQKFGIEVYGNVADMADVSVYYYKGKEKDGVTEPLGDYVDAGYDLVDPYVFGLNGAVTVPGVEGLQIGAGLEYSAYDKAELNGVKADLEYDAFTEWGIDVLYTKDTLEAAMEVSSYTYDDGPDFMEATEVSANVSYGVTEILTPFLGIGSVLDPGDDDFEDVIFYEVGVEAGLDGVTYTAGYTLGADWKAYDAGFEDDDGDRAGNFFVKVGAEF